MKKVITPKSDLERLLSANESLMNNQKPKQVVKTAIELITGRIPTRTLGFFTFKRSPSVFRFIHGKGIKEKNLIMQFDDKVLWENIRKGRPFKFSDENGLTIHQKDMELLKSEMWVPLVHQSKILGLLTVGKKNNGEPFDPADNEYLDRVSHLVSFHLSLALKQKTIRRENIELDDTKKVLSILSGICDAMTSMNNQSELLRYILKQSINSVDAEKGSLLLYDELTNELHVRVVEGSLDKEILEKLNRGEIPTKSFKPGQGIAGKVYKTGDAIIVNDVEKDKGFVARKKSFVNSIVCVPLIVHGESIGVINLTNKMSGGEFSKQDMETLKTLAGQAAVALNRALLWEMAVKDSLTGLFVRRFTLARLHEEQRRARRYEKDLSVILADIDKFKRINDNFGHPAGDRVLREIADTIRDQLRDVDIVGRYGGEEFLIVLPETSKKDAFMIVERLRAKVGETSLDDLPKITISAGIASFPEDDEMVDALISKADTAMLEAKAAGRDRTFVFGPHMISVGNGELETPESFTRVMAKKDLLLMEKLWK